MKIDPQNVLAALHALGGHATNKQLAGALGVHGAKTRSGYRRVAAVTKALAAEGKIRGTLQQWGIRSNVLWREAR